MIHDMTALGSAQTNFLTRIRPLRGGLFALPQLPGQDEPAGAMAGQVQEPPEVLAVRGPGRRSEPVQTRP